MSQDEKNVPGHEPMDFAYSVIALPYTYKQSKGPLCVLYTLYRDQVRSLSSLPPRTPCERVK